MPSMTTFSITVTIYNIQNEDVMNLGSTKFVSSVIEEGITFDVALPCFRVGNLLCLSVWESSRKAVIEKLDKKCYLRNERLHVGQILLKTLLIALLRGLSSPLWERI